MNKSRRVLFPFLAISVVLVVTLACGGTASVSPTNTAPPQGEISPPPENQQQSTNPPQPTNTPQSTNTPKPSNTPLPPTSTADPNIIDPGTYLVGTDIKMGLYQGKTGTDIFDSCYWERLKDLSGDLDSIIENNNSIGQYYIEVGDQDFALKTSCELYYLASLPEPLSQFPTTIEPGMYLVGIDIQPGTYKGQTGTDITDSCYWERLNDLSGDLSSIIANDNSIGQYYVQINQTDFALQTACELERIGD